MLSLAGNVVLLITLFVSLLRHFNPSQAIAGAVNHSADAKPLNAKAARWPIVTFKPGEIGEQRRLTYGQWLEQLKQEAKMTAALQPSHLTILAGDSISLWFPSELLPSQRHWLNQGISGETSAGLLQRLHLFEVTKPETIFVMIGINDLLRGVSDDTVLANQQLIIQDLKKMHPQAQIVVQSILPRAAESNWEGRERLLALSNQRIQDLNKRLETMARQESIYFLDLYPLFANSDGNLRSELSTDGLHLSAAGYQTWSIALQVYSREVLENNMLQAKTQP